MFQCGSDHIGCITNNNELCMFGCNQYYQCGSKSNINYNKIIWKYNDHIISIKCGGYHNILKTNNNKYYSFGCNKNNRLLLVDRFQVKVFKPTLIKNEYLYEITKSQNVIIESNQNQ